MGFKIGVAIPIGYYHGASGQTIKARIEDEAGGVFGAELTLVENAAFVAVGIDGYYESSFTPDAAGRWTALIYYSSIKYGQMFYDVGGGLTTQEKSDVQDEAEDALEGEDLDHLMKVAHPTGDVVADSILDLIMNKGPGQTFNRATDSLEFLGEMATAILADTSTIAWGDITGIINDIGVFPTANYATLAAYVENVRTRLIDIETDTGAIVWGDVTGIVADIGVFPTANYATLAAYVEDIRTRLIAIVGDTNELQTDWADGGRLDLLIDGIIADIGVFPTANYATLAAYVEDIRTRIGPAFDGTPSLYTALITGYTGAATSTPVGAIIERIQFLQEILANANTKFQSSAATVNTVTCAALVDRVDLYEGMMLVPLDGNQAGQGRIIDSYDGTGVVTVVPDWSTDPDAGGAFYFVIVPSPVRYLAESGKGLYATYDIVDGIPLLTRIYNDYDIAAEDVEETIFEYDDIDYIIHFEWLEWHLDEMLAGDTIRVRVYVKDNDTEDNERCIFDQSYGGVQSVPVQYIQLPPTDLYFKTTVEQVDIDTALIDVLFKAYKKS